MKVALCFIISYKQILHKEKIWREWIEPNKDIINVYFHYKNLDAIQSPWIKQYCIPKKYIRTTSYYYVVPAYLSILTFAFSQDLQNKWFCLLTDSCVPIISPLQFREMFLNLYATSIFKWKPSYWNIEIHTRANLKHLKKEYHLANDPWFTFSRDHVHKSILFLVKKKQIYNQICKGGLANESLFAIILQTFHELQNSFKVINESSTISDWSRMSNATSPHLFHGTEEDILFIKNTLQTNKYAMFLRKISKDFPENILKDIIYNTKTPFQYSNRYFNIIKKKSNFMFINLVFLFFFVFITYFYFNISIVDRIQDMLQK